MVELEKELKQVEEEMERIGEEMERIGEEIRQLERTRVLIHCQDNGILELVDAEDLPPSAIKKGIINVDVLPDGKYVFKCRRCGARFTIKKVYYRYKFDEGEGYEGYDYYLPPNVKLAKLSEVEAERYRQLFRKFAELIARREELHRKRRELLAMAAKRMGIRVVRRIGDCWEFSDGNKCCESEGMIFCSNNELWDLYVALIRSHSS